MTARIHVLLGGGGAGKTTLATAYALALARAGRRVGLLGIDPARRLEDAVGVRLGDVEVPVPGAGHLRAAIVLPQHAIRRWVAETGGDEAPGLLRNPFFAALGDRLATATDLLAAARLAEWIEGDAALEDLVVDTGPGLAAVEFLSAPARLLALGGTPLRLLWAVPERSLLRSRPGGYLPHRLLGAIAGGTLAGQLVDFLALARRPLLRLLRRVEQARERIASGCTELLLVTSPRDPGARAASELALALRAGGLAPRATVINRALPPELERELAEIDPPGAAAPLVAHVRSLLRAQAGVLAAATALAPALVVLPSRLEVQRLERGALLLLGERLATDLAASLERRRISP